MSIMPEESNPIPPMTKRSLCVLCYLSPKSNYDTLISDDSGNIRSPQLPELSEWKGNESTSEEAADREHRRPDCRFSWLATCGGAVRILLNAALTLRSLRPRWATRQDHGGSREPDKWWIFTHELNPLHCRLEHPREEGRLHESQGDLGPECRGWL